MPDDIGEPPLDLRPEGGVALAMHDLQRVVEGLFGALQELALLRCRRPADSPAQDVSKPKLGARLILLGGGARQRFQRRLIARLSALVFVNHVGCI